MLLSEIVNPAVKGYCCVEYVVSCWLVVKSEVLFLQDDNTIDTSSTKNIKIILTKILLLADFGLIITP